LSFRFLQCPFQKIMVGNDISSTLGTKSASTSFLVNLLNRESLNASDELQSEEDTKLKVRLKMPSANKLPPLDEIDSSQRNDHTRLQIVSNRTNIKTRDPKVPKLILSMRNRTIKAASASSAPVSGNTEKRASSSLLETTALKKERLCETIDSATASGKQRKSTSTLSLRLKVGFFQVSMAVQILLSPMVAVVATVLNLVLILELTRWMPCPKRV
jgi:hypothetical protein